MLANPFEKGSQTILSSDKLKIKKKARKISPQKNPSLFSKEIDNLRDQGSRLFQECLHSSIVFNGPSGKQMRQ